MANNFDSNFTRQLARVFLEKFESMRVMSKNINTQLLQGKFNPASGANVDFKRPTDYKSVRTSKGDVSVSAGFAPSEIITGKATGTVQDYFTAFVDYDEADEAIKMDQLDLLLAPLATRIVTDLELDFAQFMMENSALLAGVPGTAVSTWSDVANAGAVLRAHGIPADETWFYSVNSFTQVVLANIQQGLQSGGTAGELISDAFKNATIAENFGGLKVMSATTLASYTTPGDVIGAVDGTPDATYLTAKDTMTQSVTIDGLTNTDVFKAGSIVQITGRNRLNLSTRKPIVKADGSNIVWTGTLTQDVTVALGEAIFILTGPAVFETASGKGAFNTVDSAILDGDVATILGGASSTIQPNLFWHRQAFGIGSVPIKKLHSTDTLATTEDGLQFRVSKGTNFLENEQLVRFDFRPAYAVLNPFFAGQGYG